VTPNREETVVGANIAYFIEDSPHYLPVVLPLISETGGMLLYLRRKTVRNLDHPDMDMQLRCFRGYKQLVKALPDLHVDIMVHPSFTMHYFRSVPGIRHVQVFHGISDKPFSYHRSLVHYDLVTVPGPRKRDLILEKQLSDPEKIVMIGFPKIDHFLHSGFDRDSYRKKIGVDEEKKTVLYAPTWVDPNRFSSFARSMGEVMQGLGDFNVIVKPHVNILKYRPDLILKAYIKKRRNCFIFPRSIDILPFMAISDLMITDISSAAQEYLAFDKPLVFLHPKPGESIPEANTRIWRCGELVSERGRVRDTVIRNLACPERYRSERESARREIFVDFDGRAAKRFKEAIENFTNQR
jgi:CDP-glycerol glycerophosphotransferase (TagB/SpsB family)